MAWRVAFAAVRFDDDQLAWPHRRKGAVAGLAIAHPRRTCGQASGIAVRKADSRFASRFRQHRGDAPIVVIDAEETRCAQALPLVVNPDRRDWTRPALARTLDLEPRSSRHARRLPH